MNTSSRKGRSINKLIGEINLHVILSGLQHYIHTCGPRVVKTTSQIILEIIARWMALL